MFSLVIAVCATLLISDSQAFDVLRNTFFNKKENINKISPPSPTKLTNDQSRELNSDFQITENVVPGHHQIYKRYLNKNFTETKTDDSSNLRKFNKREQLEGNDIYRALQMNRFGEEAQKNMRDFVDKIVLNDKISMDDAGSFGRFYSSGLRIPNDTTKISSKDTFGINNYIQEYNENVQKPAFDNEDNGRLNFCDGDVYFINTDNDVKTVDHFSVGNFDENQSYGTVKREADDNVNNSSCETASIKEEIDKVYKDISENVRLLSKLRDRESHLSRTPTKKRWIIVDNTLGELTKNNRGRRCSQELTVEMDTNKDATPDRLEHIERKVEEEVLQVNVPLKCNH